mgnify:CR=1 FL=1
MVSQVTTVIPVTDPLRHPRRRPCHRPPPTSPLSSHSPTPSDIEVRPAKYPCISCVVAQIGYVVAQVAVHVQFTSSSGLCFAGVLINFRSGKFQALDMSFFSKGHAGLFREFWHDVC